MADDPNPAKVFVALMKEYVRTHSMPTIRIAKAQRWQDLPDPQPMVEPTDSVCMLVLTTISSPTSAGFRLVKPRTPNAP